MSTIAQVARAFAIGKSAKCGNASTDGTSYTLHRTVIAKKVDNGIEFNWGGYYTPATANHLNAIIDEVFGRFATQRVSYASARDAGTTTFTVTVL